MKLQLKQCKFSDCNYCFMKVPAHRSYCNARDLKENKAQRLSLLRGWACHNIPQTQAMSN